MPEFFREARLKVKRAKIHIDELRAFMGEFSIAPHLYSVDIEIDESWYLDTELVVTIHKSKEELRDDAALIIGDVYHNLRSALDLLWYEIVSLTGLQSKWTRFPILDTREELIRTRLNPALEKGQISNGTYGLVLDTIKPYREGNFLLWALEEANIIDKHQLLTPNISMIGIIGVRVQNDKEIIDMPNIFTEATFRRRSAQFDCGAFGRNPKVVDQGRAALGYGFALGHPHEGEPIVPTLNAVTEEVTRTIEAFAILLG